MSHAMFYAGAALLYTAFLMFFMRWCFTGFGLAPPDRPASYWRVAFGVFLLFISLPTWAWAAGMMFRLIGAR